MAAQRENQFSPEISFLIGYLILSGQPEYIGKTVNGIQCVCVCVCVRVFVSGAVVYM